MFTDIKKNVFNDKLISTVKLPMDHGHGGTPLWYETMVFPNNDSWRELYCERYETLEQALNGHEVAVQWVKDGCKDAY